METGTSSSILMTGSLAPTSGALLWPIAVRKPVQPTSHNELAKAIGLTTSQLASSAEHKAAKTVGTKQIAATTQCLAYTVGTYAGTGKGKCVVVNRGPSVSFVRASNAPVQCLVNQTAGKTVPMPRCLKVQPVYTTATAVRLGPFPITVCRPRTLGVSSAENSQQVQTADVHSNIRCILLPRVIPRSTFRMMASTTASACRVVKAKTVAVPAVKHPPTSSSNSMQGKASIRSAAPRQPAAAAPDSGKQSPLSCIQTLVANATTTTPLIALNDDHIPEYQSSSQSESAARDENDAVIHLSVNVDNTNSNSDFTGAATDNVNFKQPSCSDKKRPSTTDDLHSKVAKQS